MEYGSLSEIAEALKKPDFAEKKICIFGTDPGRRSDYVFLVDQGLEVVLFLDNDVKKQRHVIYDVPVVDPSEPDYSGGEYAVIVCSSGGEIRNQLMQLGLAEQLILELRFPAATSFWSLTDDDAKTAYQSIKRGEKLIRKLRKKRDEVLLIHRTRALGDLFFVMPFIQGYSEKKGIKEYRLIVPKHCGKVVDLFPGIPYEGISMEDILDVSRYVSFMGEDISRSIVMYPDFPLWRRYSKVEGRRFMPVAYMYPRYIFGIHDLETSYRRPVFSDTSEPELKEAGLVKGRSVILTPVGNTVVGIPMAFWKRLAEELKERGYRVFTSVVGEEKPIDGTRGIFIPIAKLEPYMSYAGVHIGLRSGVCDMISACEGVRQWILYTQFVYKDGRVTSNLIWDKMENGFVRSSLYELECGMDEDTLDKAMDRILTELTED